MENQDIRNYSEVKKQMEPAFPDAEKAEQVTVLNKPVVIHDFKAFPSSLTVGKEFVVILADLNGRKISFSSGEIVLKQLKDLKERNLLPVRTTITRQKGKRYYTLS